MEARSILEHASLLGVGRELMRASTTLEAMRCFDDAENAQVLARVLRAWEWENLNAVPSGTA